MLYWAFELSVNVCHKLFKNIKQLLKIKKFNCNIFYLYLISTTSNMYNTVHVHCNY